MNELKELPNCFPIISDITSDEVQSAIRESLKEIGAWDISLNDARPNLALNQTAITEAL